MLAAQALVCLAATTLSSFAAAAEPRVALVRTYQPRVQSGTAPTNTFHLATSGAEDPPRAPAKHPLEPMAPTEPAWLGVVTRIDPAGDWGATLAGISVPEAPAPWRLGVVMTLSAGSVVVGLAPASPPDGTLQQPRDAVILRCRDVQWANKRPSRTPGPAEFLYAGDVIWVGPTEPENPQGRWIIR